MPFERALSLRDLPLGAHAKVFVGGQPLLLSHLDGQVFAVHDTCLHRGGSLAAGPLQDGVITCPLHFWGFDVRTGVCTQVPSLALKAFPTKIDDGEVYVEI
jgi:nitrite reductase (NADH) small subunit